MMQVIDLDRLSLCPKSPDEVTAIDYVQTDDMEYAEFYENYLLANRPCVLKGVANQWPCQLKWISNGEPNISYFRENYGDAVVPVADCNEKYFNSQCKTEMSLRDYADHWQSSRSPASDTNPPCLYLKDWHFQRDYPNDKVYELPKFFSSDWLNEYLLSDPHYEDDYRFVYIGPKGSWTPFHSDVFSSFSWSANVCGRKRWLFLKPGDEDGLRDKFGRLPYSLLPGGACLPGDSSGGGVGLVLVQEPGDAIFVPSGWHHQVWNMENTISINHNWVNACNIGRMWKDILKKLAEVEDEIRDCRDMDNWEEHCQVMLASVYGMNLKEFCRFVSMTASVRLDALKGSVRGALGAASPSPFFYSCSHLHFDLSALAHLFRDILKTDIEAILGFRDELSRYVDSIDNIVL